MGRLTLAARASSTMVRVVLRRALRGPRRPGWSWRAETLVELTRWMVTRAAGLDVAAMRAGLGPRGPFSLRDRVDLQPGVLGGVPVVRFVPRAGVEPQAPVVFYLHGGAYVMGSSMSHRDLLGALALGVRATVVSVDYRLAPEHPLPAAVDDVRAAWQALLRQGVDPRTVVVAGDSAGGGLALLLMLSLRDAGLPLPARAALLSPWVDLAAEPDELAANQDYDYLDPAMMPTVLQAVLGPIDPHDPGVSPVYADLAGLPPLLVLAGGAEILRPQVERLAGRARTAGVDATLEVGPDMVHVWPVFAPWLPEAALSLDRVVAYLHG